MTIQLIADGMQAGDRDANRSYHRLFSKCVSPGPLSGSEEREREHAIGMVALIVTHLLPVAARLDFMAAAGEDDEE
jgi:hypothetical protein